jgi:hypothetical protein
VHGDEASGSDAGLALTYQLAAGTDPATLQVLQHTIELIDPCQNPDGRRRFLAHVRAFGRQEPGADDTPEALEHTQLWPGGRRNHYRFDLNREQLDVVDARRDAGERGGLPAQPSTEPPTRTSAHVAAKPVPRAERAPRATSAAVGAALGAPALRPATPAAGGLSERGKDPPIPLRDRPGRVPGAIVRVHFDPTHFLTFGQSDTVLYASMLSDRILRPSVAGWNVGLYAREGLRAAGFIWPAMEEALRGMAYVVDEPRGKGHVILFAEDLAFRGAWEGPSRLLLNAFLLGPILRR